MTSTEKTLRHINRVSELLGQFASEFIKRAALHDRSKFDAEEAGPLAEMDALIERDGNVPFGSHEYEERKKLLGPMLRHHYENNSHHPEHYANGVDGMDLFDLVEMFADWKAASERGEQSSIGVSVGCEKYKISPQLENIMKNTAFRLGWKID